MHTVHFHAMGCQMMAAVDSTHPAAQARLDQAPAWFETWEQRLSRFRPDSELSQVNRSSGKAQPVSSVLAEVVQAALAARRESEGLVDPLVLNALEAAGYDRSFDQIADLAQDGCAPQGVETALTQQERGISNPAASLHLDTHRRTLTLPVGARLDLGGIAKGWAADRAAQRLGKTAPALVDAGGDIAVSGPQANGRPWPVGVANPFDPDRPLDLLLLYRGGVATSGRDYRRWQQNGAWQHHIIDPRSARPAASDVLSVSVIAPSARLAEAAAKTVLILGSQAGLRWLDARPQLAGLLVLEDSQILPSRLWHNHIWRN